MLFLCLVCSAYGYANMIQNYCYVGVVGIWFLKNSAIAEIVSCLCLA